jgi:hypothetical protein
MALGSRFLVLLALTALAAPARAQVVTLVCQSQERADSMFTLRVDYDRKMVTDVHTDGSSGAFVPANITEGAVTWEHVFPRVEVFKNNWGRFSFSGQLNRLTGQGWIRYWRMDTNQGPWMLSGLCAPAVKKF